MIDQLLKNNQIWAKRKTDETPDYFSKHADIQSPEILFIGCVDSRVLPHNMLGLGVGDLFVHRNVANLVNEKDTSIMATIQFAVEELKVKYIVVCGHYGCGGIKAAMTNNTTKYLTTWLEKPALLSSQNQQTLSLINNENERWNKMVEINVHEQVQRLKNLEVINSNNYSHPAPQIRGLVYDLESGQLKEVK